MLFNLICKEPIGQYNSWGEPTWIDGIEYYICSSTSEDSFIVYKRIPFSGNSILGEFATIEEAQTFIIESHTSNLMPFLIKCSKKDGTFTKIIWRKEKDCWVSQNGQYKIVDVQTDTALEDEYVEGFIAYELVNGSWKETNRGTSDPFYSLAKAKNWIDWFINADRIHEERLAKARNR